MGFETLLGNGQLKQNLAQSLEKGRISHFYLISGPQGSGKHTLAKLLASAILCRSGSKPCGVCHVCRKVMEGSHPDFITVEDPEHKNVAVKIVRQFREDVFIRPNESEHKIYLFPQELGVEGQNALLKILEEPPKYGVFILLTENPEKLLPTVRSRCTLLQMQALPDKELHRQLRYDFPKALPEDLEAAMARSGGFLGQARALLQDGSQIPPQTLQFAEAFGSRDAYGLIQTLVPMEKWKRDALIEILTQWQGLLESALFSRSGLPAVSPQARQMAQGRTAAELHAAAAHIQKALEYVQGNVSPAAVCGWLAWALR